MPHITSTSCDDWSVAAACGISSAGSSPGQLRPVWSVGLGDQEQSGPPVQLLLAAVQLGAGSSLEITPVPAQSVGSCASSAPHHTMETVRTHTCQTHTM